MAPDNEPNSDPARRTPPAEGNVPPARPVENQPLQAAQEDLRFARHSEDQPLTRSLHANPELSAGRDTPASARAAEQAARRAAPLQTQAPTLAQAQPAALRQPAPADTDDMIAGLEEAALRDIGADLGGEKADSAPGGEEDAAERKKRREQRRLNRAAKAAETGALAAGAGAAKAADGPKAARAARANAADGGEKKTLSREERQERRAEKLRRTEEKGNKVAAAVVPAPITSRAVDRRTDGQTDKQLRKQEKTEKAEQKKSTVIPREWGIPWTALSFLLMVLVPAAITSFYYIVIASPQYQVETQFAVRGSSQSSMATLGLGSILGGTSVQTGDSYIVTSYVESLQLIRDVQQQLGIDLRQFYARDHIDWLYRINPDMPLEKFTEYWRDMTDVSFNATTGNTTLYIYGFSAEDSKAIADAVLKVSERLVNELSESNRQQVMQVASKQVDRAEERLRKVQAETRKLREKEKVTDPATVIALQNQAISALQGQLSTFKTRHNALLKSVSADAPQAKSLQKQIDALEAQIIEQQAQLGTGTTDGGKALSDEEKANLAEILTKFEELTIEQNFATQAYTTALAAFETAIVEAQRQERYFATFVTPTRPEIALYPMRYLDSFIAFLVLLAVWMVTQFIYRSFRDHAI